MQRRRSASPLALCTMSGALRPSPSRSALAPSSSTATPAGTSSARRTSMRGMVSSPMCSHRLMCEEERGYLTWTSYWEPSRLSSTIVSSARWRAASSLEARTILSAVMWRLLSAETLTPIRPREFWATIRVTPGISTVRWLCSRIVSARVVAGRTTISATGTQLPLTNVLLSGCQDLLLATVEHDTEALRLELQKLPGKFPPPGRIGREAGPKCKEREGSRLPSRDSS